MADILKSEEWQKATDYLITDEDIERQRKLSGATKRVDFASTSRPPPRTTSEILLTAAVTTTRCIAIPNTRSEPAGAVSLRRA